MDAVASFDLTALGQRYLRHPTYKDVATVALARGIRAIDQIPIRPSRTVMRRTVRFLRKLKRGDLADAMTRWFQLEDRRGTRQPKEGDLRLYKVQSIEGFLYIRVPAEYLNLGRGQKAAVKYERGQMKVVRADGLGLAAVGLEPGALTR